MVCNKEIIHPKMGRLTCDDKECLEIFKKMENRVRKNTPENKTKAKAYRDKPENKDRRKAYDKDPKNKARRKAYMKTYYKNKTRSKQSEI